MKTQNYESPAVEVLDMATEQAFAASALDSAAFDETGRNEVDLFLNI